VLVDEGRRRAVHVRSRDEALALAAATDREATRALVGPREDAAQDARAVALPRWPFFLAWLALVAMLWLLERALRVDVSPS
jgi:hypothetical protein